MVSNEFYHKKNGIYCVFSLLSKKPENQGKKSV